MENSGLQIIRLLKSQPDGGHSQVTQSLKSTVKNGESNLVPKPPKAVSKSILDSTAVTKQDVLGRIRSKSECGNSLPVSENVTQPPKFSILSGAQRPLPRPELPSKSSSLRSSTISTDLDSKLDCTYEGAVLNDVKKYGTGNDINSILSSLSNISSVLFQLKQDQRATFLNIESIKENMLSDLKILTKDVESVLFTLAKLNKESYSNLLTFQDELSQKIDFVHSSLSKKLDSVQDQLNDVLILLKKLSKSDVDKKEKTQRSGESKKRSESDTKRTDKGPEEKKSKN